MGVWLQEELILNDLPTTDRQANIEVVSSAYASLIGPKSFVSMAVTTGKRYYDALIEAGVRTKEELEHKRPGALLNEVVLPNLEAGVKFAERISPELKSSIIVPGIFEAKKQNWTQDEYKALWLRLLRTSIKEIYFSEDWEYSPGGVAEFVRAVLLRYGFVQSLAVGMEIFDHHREPLTVGSGVGKIVRAIKRIERYGLGSDIFLKELSRLAWFAEDLIIRQPTAQLRPYHEVGGLIFNPHDVLEWTHHLGLYSQNYGP